MKVLYVEDEQTTRDTIELVLRRLGYEVAVAGDGEAGFRLYKSFKPDLIISDIQMPVMDGLQLLKKVRKEDPYVLFVMASSLDASSFTLEALRLRANDYLVKPLNFKELGTMLGKYDDILSSRNRDREVLGMIFRRDLGMRIDNRFDLVSKIVDRLMLETESGLAPQDRMGIHLGLVEMLTNAIEHGNLQITYEEKTEALEGPPQAWKDLMESRSRTFADRQVILEFKMDLTRMEWIITDQGPGFNWQELPDPNDPENLLASHGRGIMLTRLQFDEITYLEKGNKVRLMKKLGCVPTASTRA